jgi:hypothetical protein
VYALAKLPLARARDAGRMIGAFAKGGLGTIDAHGDHIMPIAAKRLPRSGGWNRLLGNQSGKNQPAPGAEKR